jgi:ketosteroid isomerase-like protein
MKIKGGGLERDMDEVRDTIEKLKILERLAAYTLTIDGKDAVRWANCFTEDGIFGQGGRAIRGRETLRAYAEIHGRTLGSRHITSSPCYRIDESGVRAAGRATTVVTVATPSGYKIAMTGIYDDVLEKIGDDWLIARRMTTVEGLPNDPAYSMLAADPEMAAIVQPLLDAWQRLSDKAIG